MKFDIKKKKAIQLFSLLGGDTLFSNVAIKSSQGKIISGQLSDIYKVTRFAEYDQTFFNSISYDTSDYHSFNLRYYDYQTQFNLKSLLKILKAKNLLFQFPHPMTEKLGNNFLCISYPDVSIHLFVGALREEDKIEKFFKIVNGRAILKDNSVLDTVIKIDKNTMIQALKSDKHPFAEFSISISNDMLTFESLARKRKPGFSIVNFPCQIKKCDAPIQLRFQNGPWLPVLNTLETNPTIYLGHHKPALLVNNFRDHRIAFLIPCIEEEKKNEEKKSKKKNHKSQNR